jgi:hypothetical protein
VYPFLGSQSWVAGKIDKILKEIDDFDRQFGAEQDHTH